MTEALLALADGSTFRGISIGAEGESVGEAVFNTAITGYQEILTDPSYARQIVTLTHPHIGNTGCNAVDEESAQVHAAGLVIRDLPRLYNNWRSKESLGDYLRRNNIVGIADIDTRRLTRILRDKGAQNACLVAGNEISDERALARARMMDGKLILVTNVPDLTAAEVVASGRRPVTRAKTHHLTSALIAHGK